MPTNLSPETRAAVLQQQSHETDLEGGAGHCLVCYSDLIVTTKTTCDHNEICGICHLRLRLLHKDNKCPICKTENEMVIVDYYYDNNHDTTTENDDEEDDHDNDRQQQKTKLYADYPMWGTELGSAFIFREDVGMFFPRDYFHKEVEPLFGFRCTAPNCNFDGEVAVAAAATASSTKPTPPQNSATADSNDQRLDSNAENTSTSLAAIRALQNHLRDKHRTALCGLCVENHRDFVVKLPRFTSNALKVHLTKGDGPGSGFDGHPLCEFCRPTRFYDVTQLHQHLSKDHYKCHVCQQHLGLDNQYFKDYRSLERHFDQRHFLCHDVQCLTARFVVFGSELDLLHHERTTHGGTSSGSTKIQVQFRVRREHGGSQQHDEQQVPDESDFGYGLDGEAFVPPALPPSQGALQLHPLHVQRTQQLREQAASLRQASTADESFPTLQSVTEGDAAAQQQQRLRMGWTEGTTLQRVAKPKAVGAVTQEEFPALPAPAKKPAAIRPLHQYPAAARLGGAQQGIAAVLPSAVGRGTLVILVQQS